MESLIFDSIVCRPFSLDKNAGTKKKTDKSKMADNANSNPNIRHIFLFLGLLSFSACIALAP
jgi:hypothetical protein